VDCKETEKLLEPILRGEIDGFEAIVGKFQVEIFRYCYHILGNRKDAEDALQEIFVKAYRNLGKYNRSVPFSAWLYKIAYNHCVDQIRKRKWKQMIPFFQETDWGESHIDQHIEEVYFSASVHQAMAALSIEERTLLILRGVEEKTCEEISLIMKKNTASLRKKFERAAAKFRKAYSLQEKGGAANAKSARFT